MIDITVLGTGSMVPTKDRNLSAIYAEIKGIGMLFDCGEGTQRQMNIAGINRNKVNYIFISHWHADHMSGLLGLLQTICNAKDLAEISIFGPKGTKEHMDHLLKASIFDNKLKLHLHEIIPNGLEIIFKNNLFSVSAIALEHGIPCIGFRLDENNSRKIAMSKLKKDGVQEGPWIAQLQEGKDMEYNGKKYLASEYTSLVHGTVFSYVPDTLFTQNAVVLSKNADLVISEATFVDEHKEKAAEYNHMTAKQAAQVASLALAKSLVLFHFSQRYKTTIAFLEEAREIFPQTELAYDFMKIKLK